MTATDELVLSQDYQLQIHHSDSQIAQSAVIWIIFSLWLEVIRSPWWKKLLEANLSCSKQLLNEVSVIWFSDKKVFALAMLNNSQNNWLYTLAAIKNKDVPAKYLHTRTTFSSVHEKRWWRQSDIEIGLCPFDLIDLTVKVDGTYYCNLLLSHQLQLTRFLVSSSFNKTVL